MSPPSFETPKTTCPMTQSHSGRPVSSTFLFLWDTNCLQYILYEPWLVADHFSIDVYLVCWCQLRTVYQRMFRNHWW